MCLGECLEIMGSTLTLFVPKAGKQMEILTPAVPQQSHHGEPGCFLGLYLFT